MRKWKHLKLAINRDLLASPKAPFVHRDLSWLQFNDRVIAEAKEGSNPLLKRLKFLSISDSNLDEFFMIRVASLYRATLQSKTDKIKRRSARQFKNILKTVKKFTGRQSAVFDVLRRQLRQHGILLHLNSPPGSPGHAIGKAIFEKQVAPFIDSQVKFNVNLLSKLRNLQMLLFYSEKACVPVPKSVPNVFVHQVKETAELHFFFLDDLLATHMQVPAILRITRDADFTVDLTEQDSESVPDVVSRSLGGRDNGRIVRLEYVGKPRPTFQAAWLKTLRLHKSQCFRARRTLCMHAMLGELNQLAPDVSARPGYNNPIMVPLVPPQFSEAECKKSFTRLKTRDYLFHHPYDSYDAFVNWIKAACEDPEVTMIEQTVYRVDSLSIIMDLLKKAAKKKKVRVILELRARFDELNNIRLSEELEKAGVEVAFGFGALKLHAKLTLVTRKEGDQERLYTHISTGNYNAKTARHYTDLAILTANEEIGADARHFFDSVWREHTPASFRQLVVAPTKLHQRVRSLIRAETAAALDGKPARIVAKVNSLVDESVIEDLYKASNAGVKIDLIVRGACSLLPGVKGLSENIRVISIVDRFLEHSRIYYFENSRQIYISSADWMPRNFYSRLEIAYPVLDSRLYKYISEFVIPAYLNDTVKARQLNSRGVWMRRKAKIGEPNNMRAQVYFETLAQKQYRNTPLYDEKSPFSTPRPQG